MMNFINASFIKKKTFNITYHRQYKYKCNLFYLTNLLVLLKCSNNYLYLTK